MASGRYLIVRLSALGDVVFALEALAALKEAEPDAVADWVVEERTQGLLDGHPWVRRVIVFPRRALVRALPRPWLWPGLVGLAWGYVRNLRRERYDGVLDLQGNFKSAVPVFLARGRRKIGFAGSRARELSWLAARERVPVDGALHRAEQGRRLVARLLGRDLPAGNGPLVPECPRAAGRAEALLAGHPAGNGAPIVCLAPGSSAFAAFKRWPSDRHRELAAALARDELRVVVCTGPGEDELAAAVMDGRPMLWCNGEELGLPVVLEVMRRASLVVAADSGPLHLAQAVGTPAIALFGPKDPALYGPRLPRSLVLRYPTSCAPCGRRSCDSPLCVRAIPVEGVRAAVREVLETA